MNARFHLMRSSEQKAQLNNQLPKIENVLGVAFKPIALRSDFISSLKTRLNDPESVRRFRKLSNRDLFFIIITLTSILMLVLTTIKLLFDFFSGAHRRAETS